MRRKFGDFGVEYRDLHYTYDRGFIMIQSFICILMLMTTFECN